MRNLIVFSIFFESVIFVLVFYFAYQIVKFLDMYSEVLLYSKKILSTLECDLESTLSTHVPEGKYFNFDYDSNTDFIAQFRSFVEQTLKQYKKIEKITNGKIEVYYYNLRAMLTAVNMV